MITKQGFVKKLKILIKDKFRQQKIFAQSIGVNEKTVGLWLKGENMPNVDVLFTIANHCNIDISYFFNDESNANIVDEKLFDKVFALAYDLACENDITISGSYFLGCYDLVVTTIYKDSTDYLTAFNMSKQLILKLASKG